MARGVLSRHTFASAQFGTDDGSPLTLGELLATLVELQEAGYADDTRITGSSSLGVSAQLPALGPDVVRQLVAAEGRQLLTLDQVATMVRRNCTPPWEAVQAGGDTLVAAVADWIANPPEWVQVPEPGAGF